MNDAPNRIIHIKVYDHLYQNAQKQAHSAPQLNLDAKCVGSGKCARARRREFQTAEKDNKILRDSL
jgi:hypothetical protein